MQQKLKEVKNKEAENSLASALKSRAKSTILSVLNSGSAFLNSSSKAEAEKAIQEIEREEEQSNLTEQLNACMSSGERHIDKLTDLIKRGRELDVDVREGETLLDEWIRTRDAEQLLECALSGGCEEDMKNAVEGCEGLFV